MLFPSWIKNQRTMTKIWSFNSFGSSLPKTNDSFHWIVGSLRIPTVTARCEIYFHPSFRFVCNHARTLDWITSGCSISPITKSIMSDPSDVFSLDLISWHTCNDRDPLHLCLHLLDCWIRNLVLPYDLFYNRIFWLNIHYMSIISWMMVFHHFLKNQWRSTEIFFRSI